MSPELQPEPWLVYIDKSNNDDDTKAFYKLPNGGGGGHVVAGNIPVTMRNKIFWSCSHDWFVIMHTPESDCTLVNPRTMETFSLPNLTAVTDVIACAVLRSNLISSGVFVVLMTCDDRQSKKVNFVFCKLGDESWTEQDDVQGARCICQDYYPDVENLPKFAAMGSFGGELYVLSCCCKTECIKRAFFPKQSLVQCSPTELMIVEVYANEYREDIGVFDNNCRAVELYKVNLQDRVWTRLETLPQDSAVFIGSHPSNILLCNGGGESNVYFMQPDDRYLYAYDVRERSITVSLPSPDVKHDVLQAVWMPPLCSLSSSVVDVGDDDVEMHQSDTIVVSEDRWCNIPIHLLVYIQSLLFGADRCCFRRVCRTWQLAFSGEATSTNKMGSHGFPMLIHIGNNEVGIFDPITNSGSTFSAPELIGGVIRCSKNGWLLVTQGSCGGNIFFYNPFTKERIDLPNLGSYDFEGITFTLPPTSSQCMIFGYSISSPVVKIKYLHRGRPAWQTREVGIDTIGSYESYSNPFFQGGKFYVTQKARNYDSTSKPCSSMKTTNVVDCDGRLLLVSTGHLGRFVRVSEFDEDTKVWKKLDNLEDEILFVSSGGSCGVSCKGAEISGLGNKVFLDRFNGEDGVFYSLATNRTDRSIEGDLFIVSKAKDVRGTPGGGAVVGIVSHCCKNIFKLHIDVSIGSVGLLDLNLRKPDRYQEGIKNALFHKLSLVQFSPTELMIVEIYSSVYSEDKGVFDNDCRGVELYTVDLQHKVWTRLQTLPRHSTVFVGTHGNNILLCNGTTVRGGGGNTVYFLQLNDRYLYAYDVQERSITVSLPWPDVSIDVHKLRAVWLPPLSSLKSSSTYTLVNDADVDTEMSDTVVVVSEDRWCKLPIHLLSYIQSLLFGADRCYFRLVCKTWQLAFNEKAMTTTNMGAGHGFPMLLHIGNNDQVGIFDPITNSRGTLPAPDLTRGVVIIRSSNHGWLLVTEGSHGRNIFFYNPFTKQRIDLPNLPSRQYEFEGIAFTSPPTSSDCMVFGYKISSRFVNLGYLYRGCNTWQSHRIGIDTFGGHKSYANPVYHRGKFCFIPKQRNPDSTTSEACSLMRRTNVVECDGRLLLVATGHLGRFVQVFELNEDDMVAIDELVQVYEVNTVLKKLECLEDKMLFLSTTGSTLSATCKGLEISGLGNKVFLDRFNGEDGVFYSLATRKFHTFWSGYESHDWCDTKEYTHSDWIKPNFEMHTKEQLQWV
ncbi:F-box/kelch-repeat protein At1g57790 [Linum grandiflorum]